MLRGYSCDADRKKNINPYSILAVAEKSEGDKQFFKILKPRNYDEQIYQGYCRNFHSDQPIVSGLCEYKLALVYSFCGCQFDPVFFDQMVLNGENPQETWR